MERSSSGGEESASAARKRQATSTPAPLDEDPLGPSSSTQQHDTLTVASNGNVLLTLLLPFVQDLYTWNSVCCANKDLMEASKKMRPPWPNNITLNSENLAVSAVAFSPCNSFLACGNYEQTGVHVWDRHGEHTRLEGHTSVVTCLQYSLDGKYLASGSSDGLILLWRATSESGTLQARSDIIVLGHRGVVSALAFSPTDSNLLASGGGLGEIKFWDVINQVCIHAFDTQVSTIRTIFFSPGDTLQCYVATMNGRMIRIARNETMELAATILEESSPVRYFRPAFSRCGTCFAAILFREFSKGGELALFDLRTMVKTQSVVISDIVHVACLAMSPDGKKLAITHYAGGIRRFECRDLAIQEYAIEQTPEHAVRGSRIPIAFDPTSRLFAVACGNRRVVLRTI
jgi:WD40 repeat protein